MVLYSIVPWIGVMAAGFGFGKILCLEPARRDRLCLGIGLFAIGLFCVLRGFDLYGDPRPWGAGGGASSLPSLLAFLNANKYPASFAFLLMTLGPTIAAIPPLERCRGSLSRQVTVFGRVPFFFFFFFFYLLHIPLIHVLAIAANLILHPLRSWFGRWKAQRTNRWLRFV